MSDAAWMIAGLYVMVAVGFISGSIVALRQQNFPVPTWSMLIAGILTAWLWPFWFGAMLPKLATHVARMKLDD